jgi:predicted ATP-grasp superfamily ATP-dependent carboligase
MIVREPDRVQRAAADPTGPAAAQSGSAGARDLPPVYVMNPYYTGLGIARSLAPHGVRVVALASEATAPGVRSRFFDEVVTVPNGRDDPAALAAALVAMASGSRVRPVLFPTRDFDVVFLAEHHDMLAPLYVLPQPSGSPIMRMMDKEEVARVATRIGVPTPVTLPARSAEEVEAAIATLPFPVVVKPRFAFEWRRAGSWQRVGGQKAFVVSTPDELRALQRRLCEVAGEILVQEFVPGEDADIVVCCCCMGRDGTLLGQFTARKLRQNPPLVGTGSVIEAMPVPEIVAPAVALLRSFGYQGIAEIEFKHDRARDRFSLIEINPRHWDQHELGSLVGINMSWLAYADLVGLPPQPCAPLYRPGERYKWIAEAELARSFARSLWMAATRADPQVGRLTGVRRACADLRGLMRGRRMFATARFSDPVPGILTALRAVRELCGSLVAKTRRMAMAGASS